MQSYNAAPLNQSPTRIHAFDLARGLAVFFMVLVHVLGFYSAEHVGESIFGYAIGFLGCSPSAPVFMFIMGIFIVLSTRTTPAQGIKRGLGLLALGYALNLFRGTLPKWLSLETQLVSQESLGIYTPLTEFFIVDILQFAGLAFILCTLIKHTLNHPYYWLALALMVSAASPELWGRYSGITSVDRILDPLWGIKEKGVMFPLFPWLAYPLLGMAFGHWLSNSKKPETLFKYGLITGIILMILGTAISLTDIGFHIGDYYRSGPGAVIWISGFVLVWLYLCQLAIKKIKPNSIFNLLFFWSKNVTIFYCVQWLIIGWVLLAVGYQTLSFSGTIIAMVSVLIASDLLTRLILLASKTTLSKARINPA